MSKQNNLTDFLVDVANAIRTKKGTSLPINPQNFSAEIAALSGGLEVIEMTETTATIEPNKVYVWGMVESLNITLGASTNESDFFAFRFRCSKPTMTVVTVNGATWAEDTELDTQGKPILDLGSYYQCEIKGGTSALYARLMHYIPFEDSNVEAVLMANGVGDGIGITYKDAAKVTSISYWFTSNTVITAFSEFVNFSGITTLLDNTAFKGCSSLVEITLPATLTSIGTYAFQNCSALTKVNGLGSTQVNTLASHVFEGCSSLVEITLPATLTSIENYVFRGCESLKYLRINANTPPTLSWAPSFPSTIVAIYVPDESITAYQEATGWTSFASKIKGISEMPAEWLNNTLYMTTEQITTTIIKADEGKVLRRKSSGAIYGERVHLGYNYYDAGVGLSEPHLDTPDDFEEIDKPEDYEAFKIDQVKRLNRITALVAAEKQGINNLGLTNKESLEVMDWFPAWQAGVQLNEGEKVTYNGSLWRVRQTHTSQDGWQPSIDTASLFEAVNVEASGTADDPIAYVPPMEIFNGKYYTQNGVLYLCTRDSGTALSHDLSALVGLYVEIV